MILSWSAGEQKDEFRKGFTSFGKESLRQEYKIDPDEMDEFEKAVNEHYYSLGKDAFAERYHLSSTELKTLKDFIETLNLPHQLKETKCLIVVIMSHGKYGSIAGEQNKPQNHAGSP